MSQVFWSLTWFLAFAVWIGGAIGAIVHLTVRLHASPWVIAAVAVALFLLPYLAVIVYWSVIAGLRLSRGPHQPRSEGGRSAEVAPWPPPAPMPDA
jgi:hypothetical protein